MLSKLFLRIWNCFIGKQTVGAASFEPVEGRRLMAASYELGMNINNNYSYIVDPGVDVMKDLGVKSVRVWVGVSDFNRHVIDSGLKRAIEYSAAGFDVMAIVNPENGRIPTASAVAGWFDWATSNSAIKKAVDRWEVGNEVDSYHYWRGTIKQYVTGFLAPAANAIHSNGGVVVSAGPSWNPEDVKEMIDYGMLKYADYVGFHPYANGVSLLKQRIARLNEIVDGRKPIAATEWNIRGYESNKTAWASAVKDAFPIIKNSFDLNYYFALLNTTATKAGPGGIMNSNGTKTGFYSALSAGMGSGNLASALPSISKVSIFNADNDKLLVDSLASGSTINLRSFGTGNLTFVATGINGTSSVKFTYDGSTTIDNSAPFAAFGQSGSNLLGKRIATGNHTLKVQAFHSDNASGKAGVVRTFSFNVINTAVISAPSISAFKIINNSTGATLSGYSWLTANTTIKLSSLPTKNISVVAIASSNTESVKFNTFGTTIIENTAPYNALGDPSGKHISWSAKYGSFTFSATPFTANNATGTAGSTKSVKLTFT